MMRTTIEVVVAAAVAAVLAGCWELPAQHRPEPKPADLLPVVKAPGPPVGDRAEGAGESAVDSALIWSEKYSQAMERLLRLQEEKRALEDKNRELLAQGTKAELDLGRTRKELDDANELLLEMRKELEGWKSNVLGFRDEMRTAQQVQLEAMGKVIRLLGGEAPTTQPAGKDTAESDEKPSKSPGA